MLRGRCPGVFEPMPSGDGLLVRVKPPGARLDARAARRLAAEATRFGNGQIELTSRAAIQVRGLRAADVHSFAASMVSTGLADADPAVERRRTVIPSPLVGVDPMASVDAPFFTTAIEDLLARDPRFARLPPKFCVSVDSGGVLPLGDVGADIRVVFGDAQHCVAASGAAAIGGKSNVLERVARLALSFLELSARCSPSPRRMRGLTEAIGVWRLFAEAGLGGPVPFRSSLSSSGKGRGSPQPIGWIPYANGNRGAFGFGLPFGATNAATLVHLAELSEQSGDGTLRVSPWRAFLVANVAARDADWLREAGANIGMLVDAEDPRLTVSACVGRPGCASASVDARADAAALASEGLRAAVHVSGCAKGCAHPRTAEYMLVGEEGRYKLVRNGEAGDAPLRRELTIEQAASVIRGEAP